MRRLRKNKYVVLGICVALVCALYFIAQKAIDEYTFKTNGDITREEDVSEGDADLNIDGDSVNRADERRPDQMWSLGLSQMKKLT